MAPTNRMAEASLGKIPVSSRPVQIRDTSKLEMPDSAPSYLNSRHPAGRCHTRR